MHYDYFHTAEIAYAFKDALIALGYNSYVVQLSVNRWQVRSWE